MRVKTRWLERIFKIDIGVILCCFVSNIAFNDRVNPILLGSVLIFCLILAVVLGIRIRVKKLRPQIDKAERKQEKPKFEIFDFALMKRLLEELIYHFGYILYYLFYSSFGIIVLLNLFWREYLTKEVLYCFFFLAGLYVGGKVSYYCMRYISKHGSGYRKG